VRRTRAHGTVLFVILLVLVGCAGSPGDIDRPTTTTTTLKVGAEVAGNGVAPTPPTTLPPVTVPATTLDPSGRTIPDTDYAIPPGAVFMDPGGSDAHDGTQGAPVRTVNRAVDLVPTGGTIVMRGGVYRDWYRNSSGGYGMVGKGLTIQAYPHEQPWFDGTDVVSGSSWTNDGQGRWSRTWDASSFCAGLYYLMKYDAQSSSGPCTHVDNAKDPDYPAAGDPQMVFVDGSPLRQVGSLGAVAPGTFYSDWSNRTLYLGSDPAGRTVELAARPGALVLGNQQDYVVRGVGFRRFATNEYNNLTSGALYVGANRVTVENVVFTQNAGGGLFLSNPMNGSSVRNSVFARNGFNGMGSNGGSRSGTRNDLLMEGNVFDGNNAEHFGLNCSASCAAAALKLAHMKGFTFRDNIVQNGVGDAMGIWCDLDCSDAVITGNLVRNNGKHGIYYEVSDTGLIASNLVVDNGRVGIAISSANTKVYNNTVVTDTDTSPSAQGLWIYDDPRVRGLDGWTDVGPNTAGVELVNNVVSGPGGVFFKAVNGSGSASTNTVAPEYFTRFDHNATFHPAGNLYNWISPSTSSGGSYYSSTGAFHAATGWQSHGVDGGPVDPFVDRASGDYRLSPAMVAGTTGAPLPADVATALGRPAGSIIGVGAPDWAGSAG
jgi:parallel beta-helix repeat protein